MIAERIKLYPLMLMLMQTRHHHLHVVINKIFKINRLAVFCVIFGYGINVHLD